MYITSLRMENQNLEGVLEKEQINRRQKSDKDIKKNKE